MAMLTEGDAQDAGKSIICAQHQTYSVSAAAFTTQKIMHPYRLQMKVLNILIYLRLADRWYRIRIL